MATHFQDIAADLRQRITTGSLASGQQLPSETQLASQYSVSIPTLRQALEVLEGAGLVEKHQGRGNFVRWPIERMTYVNHPTVLTWPATGPGTGLDIDVTSEEIRVEGDIAALLQVRAGSWARQYTYSARKDATPQSLARIYVPHSVANLLPHRMSRSPWGHDIQEGLGEIGIRLASTSDRLIARLPTPDEARQLHISARTAVLEIERAVIDVNGRVVEAALIILPGHRTEALFTTRIENLETAQ